MSNNTSQNKPESQIEIPIVVRYSDPVMEMGSVAISRLFLYFYQYLRCMDGQRLDPREAFFLLYIMAEKEKAGNESFRLSTMVCPFPVRTRIDYAGKFRAMGLIYTIPHYIAQPRTAARQRPPVTQVHHVDWVLDALFSNLSQVYQTWHAERETLKLKFGKPKVFFRLPEDFTHTIEIPPHLAIAISEGKFYRVSNPLIARAREIVAQLKLEDTHVSSQLALLHVDDLAEDNLPSLRSERTHGEPSVRHQRTALVRSFTTTTTTSTEDAVNINSEIAQIAAFFAEAIGTERNDPTERETRDIANLLAKGVSLDDFRAVIERVVEREKARGKQVRSLAYCLPAVGDLAKEPGTEAEQEAGMGSPKPPAVTVQPQTAAPVAAQTDASTLDALTNGNAELHDLLDVIQVKNPARTIDRADVRAWLRLSDDFASFAKTHDTSPIGLVMQGVLEAIGSNSNRDGFLAANLVRRILERWQSESEKAKQRNVERSTSAGERAADKTGLGSDELRDLWVQVLSILRSQLAPNEFSYLASTRAVDRRNGSLTIEVGNGSQADWLREHAQRSIDSAVAGVFGKTLAIEYITKGTRDIGTEYAEHHPDISSVTGHALSIWHAALGELQLQMTKATFDTWVRPTHALGWKDGRLFVGVHSPYAKEWLEYRLQATVRHTVTGIVGSSVEVCYVVADQNVPRGSAAV